MSKLRNAAQAGAVGWWRRRTAYPAKPDRVRRTGAVSCAVVIGSLVLARVIAATGSRVLLALVFMVLGIAAITLFAVVIILCQQWAEEMDAADPLPVRTRGAIARPLKRFWSNAIASGGRVSRAWLYSTAPVVTGLPSRFARMVAALRREVTRDAVAQWVRAAAAALRGMPPPDVSPPASAGRLARPRAARPPPTPARSAQPADARHLHRGTSGVSPRPAGPTARAKPIHWSPLVRPARK